MFSPMVLLFFFLVTALNCDAIRILNSVCTINSKIRTKIGCNEKRCMHASSSQLFLILRSSRFGDIG